MKPNIDYWNDALFQPEPENDWSEVDRKYRLPSDEQIERLAERVNAAHVGQTNETANWVRDFRMQGLYCERAFCRVFRVPMDTTVKRYGGGRINARLRDGTKIDVVGRTLYHGRVPDLTRKVTGQRQAADIDVLVVWLGRGFEPVLYGWERDETIRTKGELVNLRGGPSRLWDAALLRPMWQLMAAHDPDSPLARPRPDSGPPSGASGSDPEPPPQTTLFELPPIQPRREWD